MSEYKVGIYEETRTIGEVEYNQNLDYWDGSNWRNGGIGSHLGVAKWKDEYVIIYGTDLEGHRDYAEKISPKEAYKLIKEFKPALFEEEEFEELLEYDSILKNEKLVNINSEIEKYEYLVEEADNIDDKMFRRRILNNLRDDRKEIWRKL